MFSYDPPYISYMNPFPGNAEGSAASGSSLKLIGYNFGAANVEQSPVVVVGNLPCSGAVYVPPSRSQLGYLACTLPELTVGNKNISITVAGQTATYSSDASINMQRYASAFYFAAYCLPGSYGGLGELKNGVPTINDEYCLPCPDGANCTACTQYVQTKSYGYPPAVESDDKITITVCNTSEVNEPYSKKGWYNIFAPTHLPDGSPNPIVSPKRLNRVYAPLFVPCMPPESCTGNNTCDVAYRGLRCSLCNVGYYRLDGACIKCPDNAILLVVAFLCACIVLMGAGYVLNKKNMHLAFVSIGVDYFQILAMFAQAKVPWPAVIQKLLRLLSVFNINIEIVAPECTIPDLSYANKWFFIMLIPLITASGFLIATWVQYINKRVIRGQRTGLWTHANGMVGSMLMAMNYLYLYLTRTTLDVFNCQTTVPPDGHEYMQAIFEECGVPGGTQMTLLPFAVLSLTFYTAAFPGFVATVLYKNRLLVMEDQILRCHRLGDVRTQAPKTHALRIRYNKMYYHFLPKYWYWRVMILARKFCIAFTSLMFNKNLTFQLAMVLLVVIVSYALQVKHVPYLSTSQYADLIHDHEKQAAAGNPAHVQIAADIAPALADAQIKRRVSTANKWVRREVSVSVVAEFFFDYNTVDAVLLFCCIIVVIGGIMFVSGTYSADFANSGLYTSMVTAGVLGTIVLSIVYLFIVFISEMYTTFWPEHAAGWQRKARDRAAVKKVAQEAALAAKASKGGRLVTALRAVAEPIKSSDGGVADTVGINPMFTARAKAEEPVREAGLPDREQWERVKEAYKTLREDLDESQREVAEHKRRAAELEAQLTVARTGGQASGTMRKKEFTPQLR